MRSQIFPVITKIERVTWLALLYQSVIINISLALLYQSVIINISLTNILCRNILIQYYSTVCYTVFVKGLFHRNNSCANLYFRVGWNKIFYALKMFYKLFGVFCSYEYDPALVLKSSHPTCYTKNTKKTWLSGNKAILDFSLSTKKNYKCPRTVPLVQIATIITKGRHIMLCLHIKLCNSI